MAGINGNVKWGIVPTNVYSSELREMSFTYRSNYLISANNPMRYQIIWNDSSVTEDVEPSPLNFSSNKGDIVNVIFDVYATTDFPTPASNNDWDLVASIKKSRDISNKHYASGVGKTGHRFTIDISQLCQDLLSYSLVPIGKGTWQDFRFGGMNGGLTVQDNVTENVSNYNVSKNGTFRAIKVEARFEILKSNSVIEESTTTISSPPTVRVINSVPQFNRDSVFYFPRYYIYRHESNNTDKPKSFLSHCTNFTQIQAEHPQMKSVRVNEDAEWLYFYIGQTQFGDSTGSDAILGRVDLNITTSDGVSFHIDEFSNTLDKGTNNGQSDTFNRSQERVCVQNVSVSYINDNNGADYTNAKDANGVALTVASYPNGIISSNTDYYYARLHYKKEIASTRHRMSEFRFFKVDREKENPYGFVRFHWLNRLGGIDSYTAKRDIVEGLSISRSTIERKKSDKTWNQNQRSSNGSILNGATYHSNTMRGGDIYKGGREVMSVDSDRNYSVYTEPLNRSTAEWLEEIMTSPNVWIEMETNATKHLNTVNPYQRPSTKEYMPVIITNGDIETVNQEKGLVKFNIEYTLAHKVNTQRN